ncbi:MAG: HSP90 family protein [Sumerlaeia bacterium]
MDHRFQVDLGGVIDLLSNHLYSGPEVFVRELLQNGLDAIRARRGQAPGFEGHIRVECLSGTEGTSLVFEDDGIGLTEQEIHGFLATIGQSSKRADLLTQRSDFLGQFGIGLLSCFLVCDEITVLTRSAKDPAAPTLQWRGRSDGTYDVEKKSFEMEPGTQVFLRARPDSLELFEPRAVRELLLHFGGLLPVPITLEWHGAREHLNATKAPWKRLFRSREEQRRAFLEFGQELFGQPFLDAIPLETQAGEIEGVAFVLPHPAKPSVRAGARVYLKDMLLGEAIDNVLPDWAFFVRAVVNSHTLRPTASRESLVEDRELELTREELGDSLKTYIAELRENDPAMLERLLAIHSLSIKALAIHDDEFCRIFADLLTFETSLGEMRLGEYRRQIPGPIRYVPTRDQFRQIARVASAQSQAIINGGYVYDAELLEKLVHVLEGVRVERVEPSELTQDFEDLSEAEEREVRAFLIAADAALRPFEARADVRNFDPVDLPALLTIDEAARFRRSLEQSQSKADPMWNSILGSIGTGRGTDARSQLTLNHRNPLVRKLARLADGPALRIAVEMLYVQALLLGHHPLSAREMVALNHGLIDLLDMAVTPEDEGVPEP